MVYYYEDKTDKEGFKPSWLDWEIPEDKDFIDLLELGDLYFPVLWCDRNGCHLFGYQTISESNYSELGLSEDEYNAVISNKEYKDFAREVNPVWDKVVLYPVIYELTKEGLGIWEYEGEEALQEVDKIKKGKREIEKEIEETVKAVIESCLERNHSNYKHFEECVDDGIYAYFEQELSGLEDEYVEILNKLGLDLKQMLLYNLKNKILQNYFMDTTAVGYAVGIQHITKPINYFLEYIVLFNKNNVSEKDVKDTLEKEGIKPYAWGIASNYENWGNFWFGVLTREKLEEIDEDLAVVMATQTPNNIFEVE